MDSWISYDFWLLSRHTTRVLKNLKPHIFFFFFFKKVKEIPIFCMHNTCRADLFPQSPCPSPQSLINSKSIPTAAFFASAGPVLTKEGHWDLILFFFKAPVSADNDDIRPMIYIPTLILILPLFCNLQLKCTINNAIQKLTPTPFTSSTPLPTLFLRPRKG